MYVLGKYNGFVFCIAAIFAGQADQKNITKKLENMRIKDHAL